MELAGFASMNVAEDTSAFVYFGLPGEPAIGPPAFMHRFAAMENPEAPISHHWLDSTHISYGVATAGLVHGNVKPDKDGFRDVLMVNVHELKDAEDQRTLDQLTADAQSQRESDNQEDQIQE